MIIRSQTAFIDWVLRIVPNSINSTQKISVKANKAQYVIINLNVLLKPVQLYSPTVLCECFNHCIRCYKYIHIYL